MLAGRMNIALTQIAVDGVVVDRLHLFAQHLISRVDTTRCCSKGKRANCKNDEQDCQYHLRCQRIPQQEI